MKRLLAFALGLTASTALLAQEGGTIVVQSTTSTQNSGLYRHILPIFEAETGIRVNVVAVGTGQAIRNARNCDGDVLLVHAKEAEEAFVADGFGVERHDVMYNDFVIVGPDADPAALVDAESTTDALASLADSKATFVSRGDDSGTHKKELALWDATGIDPTPDSGRWYREAGAGMGATLNVAVGMDAYALTDRATWTTHGNKGDHRIVHEGDPSLFNQYGVTAVSPDKCPNVRAEDAERFVDWLVSPEGQAAIGDYRLDGEALFTPNAKSEASSG